MLLNFADLKLNSSIPLYINLYEQITNAVESGKISIGEKLPSIREAASQLDVSRTTVENAYMKLCIEGIAESIPQRGYFICSTKIKAIPEVQTADITSKPIKYDFSTQKIDTFSSDADAWKKQVRSVLRNFQELTSYGDPQGEPGLRKTLSAYSYKARGVRCTGNNIIIGAGIGPLLGILCGLIGRDVKVGIENGGFSQASRIFSDYGIESCNLPSDNSGATLDGLKKSRSDILLLLPSALGKITITSLSKRRNEYLEWVKEKPERLIIEDDYNGELRYTARSVSAFQGKCPENTVYIGSFSKLLLPSVRIAYMVLPDNLAKIYYERKRYYNQTCGKIEQLALENYIESGALEKHLRRLRKLYYEKSRIFCQAIRENLSLYKSMVLYETSLTVKVKLYLNIESHKICDFAEQNSIKLIHTGESGIVGMCFAGIAEKDIENSMAELDKCLKKLKTNIPDSL